MEIPRDYQQELFNISKNENIIAVLPTGSGKTLIATLVIAHRLELLQQTNQQKIIVFIAPTRILATQQCEYISRRIKQSKNCKKVKSYTGRETNKEGLSVESWKESTWLEESSNSTVMVMTPGVLLGILRKSLLPLTIFDYFIFDECHHARGESPMALVCRQLKTAKNPPRILGLTASPVIGKKESKSDMEELEKTLNCRMIFADELNRKKFSMPTCSIVKYQEDAVSIQKSTMVKSDLIKHVNNTSRLHEGNLHLVNNGILILCHTWMRMVGVVDLLTIYKILRSVTSQPHDFKFLSHLNLPSRATEGNVSDLSITKLGAFKVQDNIGNQTFNLVRDISAKIRQVMITVEESGALMGLYTFQASLAENELEDITNVHQQLINDLNSHSLKSLVIGCTLQTIDVKNFENIAKALPDLPFKIDSLFEAEANTCLSLLDCFFTLVAVFDIECLVAAKVELEEKIQNRIIHMILEETYVNTSEISQIIVDILSELIDRKNDSKYIKVGSYGVIELLHPDRQMECRKYLRLDQVRVAVFEACQAFFNGIDTDAILKGIFEDNNVVYENPNLESTKASLKSAIKQPHPSKDYYGPNSNRSQARVELKDFNDSQPFFLISEKMKALCRVLYDDPIRRHDAIKKSFANTDAPINNNTDYDNIDRDCVSIVFCSKRLNAMAVSEFIKHFAPAEYLERKSQIANNLNLSLSKEHVDVGIQEQASGKRKYPQISSQCLIGGSSITTQDRILKKFKSGFSNVLIATDVAEEGVDVRACRLVVNYDVPTTVKSFIQRRGRARAKESHVVTLIPDNSLYGGKILSSLKTFNDQEVTLLDFKNESKIEKPKPDQNNLTKEKSDETYVVPRTGAIATLNTSQEILGQYCSLMASEGFYSSEVINWITTQDVGDDGEVFSQLMFQCYVLLPPYVPPAIRCVTGPKCENKTKAKAIASLECVRRLHKAGELNDFLSPAIGFFRAKKTGFKFAQSTIEEVKDDNDEVAVEDSPDEFTKPLELAESTSLAFSTTDINHSINIVSKLVPDRLLDSAFVSTDNKGSTVTDQTTSDDMQTTSGSEIFNQSTDSSFSSMPIKKKLYFYRAHGVCQECDYRSLVECSGCTLHHNAINEICVAFSKELPEEVQSAKYALSFREREEIFIQTEFLCCREVDSIDLVYLQRFHKAILCWETETIDGLSSYDWVSYEEYCKLESATKISPVSDEDWIASGQGSYYLICPLPLVSELSPFRPIELNIFNNPSLWSEHLRRCANEAQVLVHNLSVQEKLKHISLSKLGARGRGNWPHPDKAKREEWSDPTITRRDLTEYIITRGRNRLSVGLDVDPRSSIETAKQKRFDDESDDEAVATVNLREQANPNELVMMLQVSSLLTLVPLLGKRIGKSYKQANHSHNDKFVTQIDLCGLLGKARWFFYGLCAPTIVWRINSLVLAFECREIVAGLVSKVSSSVKLPDLSLFLQAITPRMCDEPINSERLEIIGDSALKLATTVELFQLYPQQQEGFLTSAREAVINNTHLSTMANKLDLTKYMRSASLSSGKQKLRFRPPGISLKSWNENACLWGVHVVTKLTIGFLENEENFSKPININSSLQGKLKNFKMNSNLSQNYCVTSVKKKTLADMLEAFIGVYFLDGGYSAAVAAIKGLGAWPVTLESFEPISPPKILQQSELNSSLMLMSVGPKDLLLAKGKKFVPVNSKSLTPDYPLQMRRIALGLVPLPQSTFGQDESGRNKPRKDNENVEEENNQKYGKKPFNSTVQATILVLNLQDHTVAEVESILGYHFKNKDLLEEALTHCTLSHRKNSQRLEFFGDAVLDFGVMSLLYVHQPWANQGDLSQQKSLATNNANLGKLAVKLDLHKYLMVYSVKLANDLDAIEAMKYIDFSSFERNLEVDEEGNEIPEAEISADVGEDEDGKEENDEETGKEDNYDIILRRKPAAVKALADAFEALVGAIYLDSDNSIEVIHRLIEHVDLLPQLKPSEDTRTVIADQ